MSKNENRIPGTEPITSLVYLLKGEKDALSQSLMEAKEDKLINRLLGAIHLVDIMLNLSYFTQMNFVGGYDVYRLVKQLKNDISYQHFLIKRGNVSLKQEKENLKGIKASISKLRERYTSCTEADFEARELFESISELKEEDLPAAEAKVAFTESFLCESEEKLLAQKALQAYLQDTRYFARLYEENA